MTAEIKPKSTKEKKRRPAPPEEFVEYAVEITEWFWEYSPLLSSGRYCDHDPYCESRNPQIIGKLMRPTGLKTEAVQISVSLTCASRRASRTTLRSTAAPAKSRLPLRGVSAAIPTAPRYVAGGVAAAEIARSKGRVRLGV